MSDQNGTVWRGAGNQRHRVSNPAVAPLTKARPARRIQKLPESKRTGDHHLAKVLEAPASDSVSSADEQIRQGELQQHGAQVASTNAFGQMAMTHLVPNVQAKWKRRTRDKRPSLPSARALGGSVPAVPIFIPADQICQERSHRDSKPEKVGHPCGSTDTVPLSAELLTRRWVRGNAS
jgi:hypothetical protein